ncbi:MAG: hypothetical protein MUF42_16285, partial [Cytophagaceae bacterium]|nr:hypothetical protein [Cytophagaceae bacterium]
MDQVITTRTEIIRLGPQGIIYCRGIKDTYQDLADAKENIAAVKMLSPYKKASVLVDIREAKGASKACRDYYASQDAAEVQSACALIVKSKFSIIVGSFFLGLNKTKFPTKLFNNEEQAIGWLLENQHS